MQVKTATQREKVDNECDGRVATVVLLKYICL